MSRTSFDDHERLAWAGRATAYRDSFAALCAYPADLLLDAAGVGVDAQVLDVGTGTGTVRLTATYRDADSRLGPLPPPSSPPRPPADSGPPAAG